MKARDYLARRADFAVGGIPQRRDDPRMARLELLLCDLVNEQMAILKNLERLLRLLEK